VQNKHDGASSCRLLLLAFMSWPEHECPCKLIASKSLVSLPVQLQFGDAAEQLASICGQYGRAYTTVAFWEHEVVVWRGRQSPHLGGLRAGCKPRKRGSRKHVTLWYGSQLCMYALLEIVGAMGVGFVRAGWWLALTKVWGNHAPHTHAVKSLAWAMGHRDG